MRSSEQLLAARKTNYNHTEHQCTGPETINFGIRLNGLGGRAAVSLLDLASWTALALERDGQAHARTHARTHVLSTHARMHARMHARTHARAPARTDAWKREMGDGRHWVHKNTWVQPVITLPRHLSKQLEQWQAPRVHSLRKAAAAHVGVRLVFECCCTAPPCLQLVLHSPPFHMCLTARQC